MKLELILENLRYENFEAAAASAVNLASEIDRDVSAEEWKEFCTLCINASEPCRRLFSAVVTESLTLKNIGKETITCDDDTFFILLQTAYSLKDYELLTHILDDIATRPDLKLRVKEEAEDHFWLYCLAAAITQTDDAHSSSTALSAIESLVSHYDCTLDAIFSAGRNILHAACLQFSLENIAHCSLIESLLQFIATHDQLETLITQTESPQPKQLNTLIAQRDILQRTPIDYVTLPESRVLTSVQVTVFTLLTPKDDAAATTATTSETTATDDNPTFS